MDRLTQMRVFVTVVERGSFTSAASALDMAKSTVSRQVADLEAQLGARLLYRTTRALHATDAGQMYVDRCRQILADVAEADAVVTEKGEEIQGTVKIAVTSMFASQHLIAPIASFLDRHPDVDAELLVADDFVNLIEEGVDVAIRVESAPPDSSLVSRRLASTRHHFVASPAFSEQHGIHALEQLEALPGLVRGAGRWNVLGPEGECSLKPRVVLRCNQGDPILAACMQGLGVALLPDFCTHHAVQNGELVTLLPAYRGRECGLYAVYPHRRLMLGRVRAFIDHLAQIWSPAPWE